MKNITGRIMALVMCAALMLGTLPTSYAVDNTAVTLTPATTNDSPVRVGTTNPVKINLGTNNDYAATQMTVTYNAALVSFDAAASTLGTATVTDNKNGTISLADYGSNKTAAADNYVLAFTVGNTAGTAAFAVTKAGFGTGDSAVNSDLAAVAQSYLGSTSVVIRPAEVSVSFVGTDYYSTQTSVEKGGTVTFYPERATGAYYDYTLPTATVGGVAATVTETSDGGWKIENVTGAVVIEAAVRTPKNFGNVAYSYENANGAQGCETDVTNKTATAVYKSDISFTIPKDVEADINDGATYNVAAIIGGSNYTFGAPAVDGNGNRTYTIPGANVTGAVTITVTKTRIESTKIQVSIGGASSDGSFEGAGAGAVVQVDKQTGNATLTVDKTSGLNKGYDYTVTTNHGTLTQNQDGTYTIGSLTQDTTVTINKTIKVEGVTNVTAQGKSFVTLDSTEGNQMWLIQLPNHVDNTTTAVYTYDGQEMFWSQDHGTYVTVVIAAQAPSITADKFGLKEVSKTPAIQYDYWDVNKSGAVDANDAQLIWNMYSNVYQEISTDPNGATAEKFILADANHDGILDTSDAVVIINKILGTAN